MLATLQYRTACLLVCCPKYATIEMWRTVYIFFFRFPSLFAICIRTFKYNQQMVCWEARAGRGVLCSTFLWQKGENLVWLLLYIWLQFCADVRLGGCSRLGLWGEYLEETVKHWRIQHYEELRNLYSFLNIIRMIKSKRMKWEGHVARMGRTYGIWWGSQKERDH
jgi:hypothetical protein